MQSPIEHLTPSYRALKKTLLNFALLVPIAVGTTACGNSLYALRVNAAASKLEEARSVGAERRAPYEYTLAKEHLDKAMSEAAEADYGDAFTLANAAYDYADQAVQRCTQSAGSQSAAKGKETPR